MKRIISALIVFLLSYLIFLDSAYATTYYVATTGNDLSSGTENAPWKTIQKAANTLVAGDTVYIRSGTYNERLVPKNSGTATNYITYTSYPSETAVLDGTGLSIAHYGGIVNLVSNSYLRISGLRMQNSSGVGIYSSASHFLIIEKNTIYNTNTSGIGIWRSDNIIVDGNDISLE
jgi:parallel beta-helix repeat protein